MMRMGISTKGKEQLIDAAFKGRPILEQWKHAATYFDVATVNDDVHFVFTVRHPLSWLIGLFQKPYHLLVEKPASLIDRARQQELPEEVPLKAARDYRFIGKHNARLDALHQLLLNYQGQSSMVFCNTKRETQDVADAIHAFGFSILVSNVF